MLVHMFGEPAPGRAAELQGVLASTRRWTIAVLFPSSAFTVAVGLTWLFLGGSLPVGPPGALVLGLIGLGLTPLPLLLRKVLAINHLRQQPGPKALERVLTANRDFWFASALALLLGPPLAVALLLERLPI